MDANGNWSGYSTFFDQWGGDGQQTTGYADGNTYNNPTQTVTFGASDSIKYISFSRKKEDRYWQFRINYGPKIYKYSGDYSNYLNGKIKPTINERSARLSSTMTHDSYSAYVGSSPRLCDPWTPNSDFYDLASWYSNEVYTFQGKKAKIKITILDENKENGSFMISVNRADVFSISIYNIPRIRGGEKSVSFEGNIDEYGDIKVTNKMNCSAFPGIGGGITVNI